MLKLKKFLLKTFFANEFNIVQIQIAEKKNEIKNLKERIKFLQQELTTLKLKGK